MKEITIQNSTKLNEVLHEASNEPLPIKTRDGQFILATEEDFEFHTEVKLLSENEQLLDTKRDSNYFRFTKPYKCYI